MADSFFPFEKRKKLFVKVLVEMMEEAHMKGAIIFDNESIYASSYPTSQSVGDGIDIILSPKGLDADTFIIESLPSITKRYSGVIAVTSDRELIKNLKKFRIKILSVEEFYSYLIRLRKIKGPKKREKPSTSPTHEIERWLTLFEKKNKS